MEYLSIILEQRVLYLRKNDAGLSAWKPIDATRMKAHDYYNTRIKCDGDFSANLGGGWFFVPPHFLHC